ncbi:MAG TPA: penicillin acylase family protein [Puia sp.]|jgi:penicillin amidase|nr:penicillin acylase family protein [Puia sp.]
MRVVPFLLSLLLTTGLVISLNVRWGGLKKTPLFGAFLSPQEGFWQNAEPVGESFNGKIALPGLEGRGTVYFDEYLIPHVFAASETDACYIQGYLHARFRLWQMEFQTFAAAGRLSEFLGPGADNAYVKYDRSMRRLGMVEAAKAALGAIEKDTMVLKDCDAYTAGVNAYIRQLGKGSLPLEYKLLDYRPEPWNNLKTALFIKYMAYELAGADNDFGMTNAKSVFSKEDLAKLYPLVPDSLDPIIPKGTKFMPPASVPRTPATADSLYFNNTATVTDEELQPERSNGSNNWAISGSKTLSGRPILCNDPHLSTNMPSIWYQMQIHTPAYNVCGVSFPGAPFVIIGFNDSCAWGITNSERDVRDYYSIKFKDESRQEYWFNGRWQPVSAQRVDTIKILGSAPLYDTVVSTVFGPVMFDPTFTGYSDIASTRSYAVSWKPADPSDELLTFHYLQSARNYTDYKHAIRTFKTPGQNFAFADKAGTIAIWQQGQFPAKWKDQGRFVMPGEDSSYLWQDTIPTDRNPYMMLDSGEGRGFVSSANQRPADTTYPYYLGGTFLTYRGLIINRKLSEMTSVSTADMIRMQTDNFNVFAQMAQPVLLQHLNASGLNDDERAFLNIYKLWKFRNDPDEEGPTIFYLWWNHLEHDIFDDEFSRSSLRLQRPEETTLLEALIRDTSWSFIDNVNTKDVKETLSQVVTEAFRQTIPELAQAGQEGRLPWAKFKDTWTRHLLRLPALSRTHLAIGGGTNCINAAKQFHGPSWRMIVELTDKTEAYGIYPGGQSGNPGSPYYDTFVDRWVEGKYLPVWIMGAEDKSDKRVKWVLNFAASSSNE